jgi:hypothetical protein
MSIEDESQEAVCMNNVLSILICTAFTAALPKVVV